MLATEVRSSHSYRVIRLPHSNKQILSTLYGPTTTMVAGANSPWSQPLGRAIASLPSAVARQYEGAVASGAAFYYPSHLDILRHGLPPRSDAGSGREVGAPITSASASASSDVAWVVRCVPALLDKAKQTAREKSRNRSSITDQAKPKQDEARSDEARGQNPNDVFAPPYHPQLYVSHLGQDHVVLLNKFCVVPRHFLLVTREFEPQHLPPSPSTLALAHRIVTSHRPSPRHGRGGGATELLCFYNCGPSSGASQPHRHLQFVEVGGEATEVVSGAEAGDDDVDERYGVPIERLLERIPRDGQEAKHVHALPLPYQHFVALLSDVQPHVPRARAVESQTGERGGEEHDEDDEVHRRLEAAMGAKLMALLDAYFSARSAAAAATASVLGQDGRDEGLPTGDARRGVGAEAEEAASGGRRATNNAPSFNLLLTKRALHLVPRSAGEYAGLVEVHEALNGRRGAGSATGDAVSPATEAEGGEGEEDAVPEVGELSVNAMAYAGHVMTRSSAELEALRAHATTGRGGLPAILAELGVENVADYTTAAEDGATTRDS